MKNRVRDILFSIKISDIIGNYKETYVKPESLPSSIMAIVSSEIASKIYNNIPEEEQAVKMLKIIYDDDDMLIKFYSLYQNIGTILHGKTASFLDFSELLNHIITFDNKQNLPFYFD
ncbi:MAG: hypothetical protein IJS54_00550 [Desulfovibrio sp.]|nr:hypothetical protein [Desulfovibrio sp.]